MIINKDKPFTPKNLIDWRKRVRASQAEASFILDMSVTAYGHLERGKNKISLRTTLACKWIESLMDSSAGEEPTIQTIDDLI